MKNVTHRVVCDRAINLRRTEEDSLLPDGTVETLALDLEGTLILNAGNPIPRPGLREFLEFCRSRFPRILIYSAVDSDTFRSLALALTVDGHAPVWFGELEHCLWDYHTARYKDLRAIPGGSVDRTGIIDDTPQAIHPDQMENWIPIQPFESVDPETDSELTRLTSVLDRLAVGD